MRTLIAVIFLLAVATGCATALKSELDAEVKRLCAIDGGVHVYETVELPPEKFDRYGHVKIPTKEEAKLNDKYYSDWMVHYYRRGNPEFWRSEIRIIRARDQKVLGSSVSYSRRGGDLPSPMHESSFTCPEIGSQRDLDEAIFLKGGSE